ncbi:MAG: metal ABC transporter ATP-binding protein [Candidatus Sumerlaeia bacterium]|nr:metal ABC transporter ATP-binding protein [Candidatus Sumerlaeia bacterium]
MSSPQPQDTVPAIRLRGVTVRREGRLLLDSVDLDLLPGDFGMLIGPNGAGKSTILRVVLGLMQADAGAVELFGEPRLTPSVRRRIGYVPQRFSPDRLTPVNCDEFLRSYAATRHALGGGGPVDRARIATLAEELGIAEKLRQPVGVLSGGELQRMLLAAALYDEPKLLLLDEPLAGVDIQGEAEFFEYLNQYRRTHPDAALVVVSHDIGVVYRYATKVFCLDRKLHASGAPEEALNRDTFARLYGHGQFPAAHHHHHGHSH